jgi:hypothetical protein
MNEPLGPNAQLLVGGNHFLQGADERCGAQVFGLALVHNVND